MREDEYAVLDATELAALIAGGSISAETVLECAIGRIERLNPRLNAVVERLYDEGRRALAEADRTAPFYGVPTVVKDLHTLVAGSRLTHGSSFFAEHLSSQDSDIVSRLRRAGFAILGRSNTPEFGINTTTEGRFHGPATNPWDRTRTPGGSSGGSAAAVASGMVPLGHATDSGGSIRIPASCCGLVGLKPSRGRVFAGLDAGEGWHDLFNAFAVTRSIRDAAGLLDSLANRDRPAPYRADRFDGSFRELQRREPGPLSIGVLALPEANAVDPVCREAIAATAQACRDHGHCTEPVSVTFDRAMFADGFTKVIASSVAATVASYAEQAGQTPAKDYFERVVWETIKLGESISGSELNRAIANLHLIAVGVLRQIERFDLILTPTLAQAPIALGLLDTGTDDLRAFLGRVFAFAPFTSLFNVTGQPAISLPVHWSAGGLPVGVQFAAMPGREDLLLQIGWQMEERFDWSQRQEKLIRSL